MMITRMLITRMLITRMLITRMLITRKMMMKVGGNTAAGSAQLLKLPTRRQFSSFSLLSLGGGR